MFSIKNIHSEQIAFWLAKHFKGILLGFSFVVLAALGFIAWSGWKEKENRKAQEALYELQESLKALVKKSENKEEEPAISFKDSFGKKPLVFSQEMKAQAKLYEEAIKQRKKLQSSVVFAIDLADFYYQRGEREQAKELLSLFAFPKRDSGIYHLASFQLAAYYMDVKECEKALEILSALSFNPSAAPFHLESGLQQALCLEHLSRYDKALHKYEAVINEDPEGYIGRMAQDYKKLLVLNRNLTKEK